MGNNCPQPHNWPVFQGLTLQFVISLGFLLKLFSHLEIRNDPRLGLHTCRCQLLETLSLLKSSRGVFVPPYLAHHQPLSTRAASVQDPRRCSPPRQRQHRSWRAVAQRRTTTTLMRRGWRRHRGLDWLHDQAYLLTGRLERHKVSSPVLIVNQ